MYVCMYANTSCPATKTCIRTRNKEAKIIYVYLSVVQGMQCEGYGSSATTRPGGMFVGPSCTGCLPPAIFPLAQIMTIRAWPPKIDLC